MGPRPDGRGKLTLRIPPIVRCRRQWGRGQTAAESGGAAGPMTQYRASMGPRPDGRGKLRNSGTCTRPDQRQWGRGQTAAESRSITTGRSVRSGRVNGAAARRPRKGGVCGQAICHDCIASMGPRPDGRGKSSMVRPPPPPNPRQWGRGQTAAESLQRFDRPGVHVAASMGPRPDGRGKGTGAIRPPTNV